MQPTYHIIIADDNDTIRSLLARVVVRTYPSVALSAVKDGSEALSIYDQRGANLVITNNDMPHLNGIGLIRALRARDTRLPIVMVSGDASMETLARATGVTVFVPKPFQIAAFSKVLTSLLAP